MRWNGQLVESFVQDAAVQRFLFHGPVLPPIGVVIHQVDGSPDANLVAENELLLYEVTSNHMRIIVA